MTIVIVLVGEKSARAQQGSDGSASSTSFVVEWIAPSECPDARALEAAVRAIDPNVQVSSRVKGRLTAPAAPAAAPPTARGALPATAAAANAGGYRADLVFMREHGVSRERSVTAETCAMLVDAVAVIVAASESEIAPPPAPQPPSAQPAAGDRDRSAGPLPTPSKPSPTPPWEVVVAARPAIDRGLLPSVVVGGVIDAGIARGWGRAELSVGALAAADARSPAGGVADIHAFLFDASVCGQRTLAVASSNALAASACVGFSVAMLRGHGGAGIEKARDEDRFVPAPKLALSFRAPARTTLGVRADLIGRVPLARPEFAVLNDGPLHRPSAVCGQVVIGPELRF